MSHKRSHITKEERFLIEKLLQAGDSYRDIAQRLGRGPSTICEEVSRNGGRSRYAAQRAEYRAYLRQYRKKRECMGIRFSQGHTALRRFPSA